jgi:putative hydrolase of the HAD superfamily
MSVSLSIPGRVVVFDYGEVISRAPSQRDRDELLAITGASAETFWPSYWSHRDALDQGTLSVPDYWATIASEIGASWRASDVQQLWSADFRSWISVEPGTVDLLAALHDGGTRIALLSNAGFDFVSPFNFSPMAQFFERVFVSAELDAIKPDPEIYLEIVGELGITIDQLVFVDNKAVNTNAAAALGATVHHYVGVDGLREFLTALAN